MIKTFRGQLANAGQDRIRLQTIKGKVGYKIVKFQCMQDGFGNSEMILKIYKQSQSSIDSVINFTDSDLLAACMISGSSGAEAYPEDVTIIFDSEIFNQDIYISAAASSSPDPTNYYLELEVIPLDDAGAEYTTLKDLRQI